jgi:hypothetical protein
MRQSYWQMAQQLPSHGEFIARIGGQKPAEPELPEFTF